mmetsp:Transcript_13244/g.26621  ORF Transcript_13244/g.26621 Transcript_13244/m.26621 type:complete len:159 (-) Transcript_13244:46-522(-)
MLWSNGLAALAVLLLTLVSGELVGALRFFVTTLSGSALLLLRSVLFYAGALLYTMLIKESGAVTAVFVTTMRKALTVALSFAIFPKPWCYKYSLGLVFLLAAIVCEYKGKPTAQSAADRPRVSPPPPLANHDPVVGEDSAGEEQQPLRPERGNARARA